MKQEKQGTGGHSSRKDWTDKLRNRLADYKREEIFLLQKHHKQV